MQAVILVGGKGERLKPLTEEVQKCMLPMCGKPLLEHHVGLCKKHGITDIVMCVGYKKENIMDHFGNGEKFGVRIRYSIEEELLGTGGAVKKAEAMLGGTFIVANGDIASKLDYSRLAEFHRKKGGDATIVVHPSKHPEDSDLVEIGSNGIVKKIIRKPHDIRGEGHVNNAGCYIMKKKALLAVLEKKFSAEHYLFPMLAERGKLYAYDTGDYMKDIGTFERYRKVQEEFCGGAGK